MPTTDERRQVAARLRDTNSTVLSPICVVMKRFGTVCDDFTDCTFCEETLFDRLAELIEPEPERTCFPMYDGRYNNAPKCSLCGEILTSGDVKMPNFCGECGARVRK